MNRWLIVSGDFTPLGGMDAANMELARRLAETGDQVEIVAHYVDGSLVRQPNVAVWNAPRPLGSHLLGAPLLATIGRWRARRALRGGARVVVNGGNCRWHDVNWVHYVHAAFTPTTAGSVLRQWKTKWSHRRFVDAERRTLARSKLVICNSQRTARDVRERCGVAEDRVRVVYYGCNPLRLWPPDSAEKQAARAAFGWSGDRPIVAFVGALGDRRKGFDVLFDAWTILCRDTDWDVKLVVAGSGAELPLWRERVAAADLKERIELMGLIPTIPAMLAACDAMVHPARYEAYGLGVHEAVCTGLPAIVSSTAGIAERYLESMKPLLIDNPEDSRELADRLQSWRRDLDYWKDAVKPLTELLRQRTWADMADEFRSEVMAAP